MYKEVNKKVNRESSNKKNIETNSAQSDLALCNSLKNKWGNS